jgi:hypothetical protein
MVTSASAGLDLLEAAGELIAEDARFNRWIHSRKSTFSAKELWNLAALARNAQSECANTWDGYISSATGAERATRQQEVLELLASYKSRMQSTRQTGIVGFDDPDIPEELLDM